MTFSLRRGLHTIEFQTVNYVSGPLLFVEALPRNATGKLPGQITQDLLTTLQAQAVTGMPA